MLLLPPVAGTAAIDTETGRPLTRADHLLRRRPATWKLHWENDKQNGPRREWTIQPFLPCLPRSMQLINNPSYTVSSSDMRHFGTFQTPLVNRAKRSDQSRPMRLSGIGDILWLSRTESELSRLLNGRGIITLMVPSSWCLSASLQTEVDTSFTHAQKEPTEGKARRRHLE